MSVSYVYLMDRIFRVDLGFGELVEMFEKDYREPLNYVRSIVEEQVGKVKGVRKYAVFIDRDSGVAVLEYIVLIDSGEISVKIVHAVNPRTALMAYYDAEKKGLVKFQDVSEKPISFEFYKDVLDKNFKNVQVFKGFREAFTETIELINDIIDLWKPYTSKDLPTLARKSGFIFNLFHFVWPLSNGVLMDLLMGNIPACFMQLRVIIENSVVSFLIDYNFRLGEEFYIYSYEDFVNKINEERKRFSNIVKNDFKEVFGEELSRKTIALWGCLSEEWLHFKGYFRRVCEIIDSGQRPRSYMLVPTVLSEDDKEDLKDLALSISSAREILQTIYGKWYDMFKDKLVSLEDSQ